tara:strand:- start:635 stop:754 length:120 start_codon:yes stop_codon:yes gene_type:complete
VITGIVIQKTFGTVETDPTGEAGISPARKFWENIEQDAK